VFRNVLGTKCLAEILSEREQIEVQLSFFVTCFEMCLVLNVWLRFCLRVNKFKVHLCTLYHVFRNVLGTKCLAEILSEREQI
jgi:hypothetical protein